MLRLYAGSAGWRAGSSLAEAGVSGRPASRRRHPPTAAVPNRETTSNGERRRCDDVGGRRRDPPTQATPENEPPDPTWLYENEPAPPSDRTGRAREEVWRVAPSREDKPRETEAPEHGD